MSHTPRPVPCTSDTAIRKLTNAVIWTWAALVIFVAMAFLLRYSGTAFGLLIIVGGPAFMTAAVKTRRAITYLYERGLPRA